MSYKKCKKGAKAPFLLMIIFYRVCNVVFLMVIMIINYFRLDCRKTESNLFFIWDRSQVLLVEKTPDLNEN